MEIGIGRRVCNNQLMILLRAAVDIMPPIAHVYTQNSSCSSFSSITIFIYIERRVVCVGTLSQYVATQSVPTRMTYRCIYSYVQYIHSENLLLYIILTF